MKTHTPDIVFGFEDLMCAADDAAHDTVSDFVLVVVDDSDEAVKAYKAVNLTELTAVRKLAVSYMIVHDFKQARVYLRNFYSDGSAYFTLIGVDENDW